MKTTEKILLCAAITVLCAGCVHIGNPFGTMRPDFNAVPEQELRTVAKTIEQAVAEGNREAVIADLGGVVVNDPRVLQAIRTRAARREPLDAFLTTGFCCELPSGLVTTLRSSAYKKATTKLERDRHAMLVMGENNDRWALYEGIVKTSNFQPDALGAVQRIFYEERLNFLKPGSSYQTPEDELLVK